MARRRAYPTLQSALGPLADGPPLTAGLVGALLVLGWVVWGATVQVSVRVDSAEAVVSQADSVFHVDATMEGVVKSVHELRSGRSVESGHVLVELDTSSVDIEIEATKSRVEGLGRARDALVAQRDAEAEGAEAFDDAGAWTLAVGQAELRQAHVASQAAARELKSSRRLAAAGVLPTAEKESALNQALLAKAEVVLRRASLDREPNLQVAELAGRRASLAAIDREIAETDLKRVQQSAELARLQAERLRHQIRAPNSGVLGAVENVRVGAMVRSGQRVASVVANSDLHIEAEFPAASAVGRIEAGQEARVRVVGFPWTRYGQLRAEVTEVGSEAVDGRVRVELDIVHRPDDFVLEHGQPAVVAIAVESATPWSIMMRYVGDGLR